MSDQQEINWDLEIVEENPEQIEKSDSIYDHPVVVELLTQVDKLTQQISTFEKSLKDFNPKLETVENNRDALLAEYQAKLDTINQERARIISERDAIERGIGDIKFQQEKLKKSLDKTVEELQAKQRIKELEKKWVAVMDSPEWATLFDYQKVGAKFMASIPKGLLADQMGLGKTRQIIEAIKLTDADFADTPQNHAVIWVTKKALMYSTLREFQKWAPSRIVMVGDGTPAQKEFLAQIAYDQGAVFIINYDAFHLRGKKNGGNNQSKILDIPWKRVITDEAHRYRNNDTHFFKNVKVLSNRAKQFYALSGTPIQNRPDDFWSILNMILPDRFPSKARFINEYCYSYGYQGTQNTFRSGHFDRLINQVKDYVIRRRKDEVELDLPDILLDERFVELTTAQRELYDDMRDKFGIWLDEQQEESLTATNVLAHFTRLMQLALYPKGVKITRSDGTEKHVTLDESAKLDEAMEIIEELLENEEKCVIFSRFNPVLHEIKRRVEAKEINGRRNRVAVITDSPPSHVVDQAIQDYDNGEVMVLCSNLLGGLNEGQNLQSGSHVIFMNMWWNPGVIEQCRDRMHRIGQMKNVEMHVIQAKDTIDAYIQAKLNEKVDMAAAVFERKELRKALDEGLI